ncbi:MAG: hypothetical protein FWD17_14210 [Polyangiaceae bacterium]|nr:hypothetical protein [Polyangiaceae bacterium]
MWNDVDFTSGTVSINKAVDARTGKSKPLPKTANAVREIPIEPNALPLLRVLHAGRTSDEAPVLPVPRTLNDKFRAKQLPEHLKLAGVDRPRLYADTMTLRPSEFRSCRGDTGITWLALTGLPLQAMLARVGHDGPATTLGYVKMAEDLKGRVGQPFPPLPASLVGGRNVPNRTKLVEIRPKSVPEEGIEPPT